jgi:hypothetical protein
VRTSGDASEPEAPFSELVRLQMDFQTRLAEETLRYLRRIQASALPATPSTVVRADRERPALRARAGESVALVERIENRQRVHAIVTALLTPLVASSGTTWFPQGEPETLIVPPGERSVLTLHVAVPAELPPGTYRGALMLTGLENGTLPVALQVASQPRRRRARRDGA